MMGIYELIVMSVVVGFIPWVIALVDILRNDFKGNDKIVWLLAVILIPFVGMIAYFFIGRKQKIKRD